MTDSLVRRANDADADAIASLLRQLGYPTESCDVPSRLARMAEAHEFYLRSGLEYTGRRSGKALTP